MGAPPLPQPTFEIDTGPSRGLLAVIVIFLFLAILATLGRFYGRYFTKQKVGSDDWIIVAALIAFIGQVCIAAITLSNGGVGHHVEQVTPGNVVLYFKGLTALQFAFALSIGLPKVAICIFLTRIFAVKKSFRVLSWFVMAYCIAWIIMVILIGAFLCRPFAFNWDKTIPGGVCGNNSAAYVAIAALDIIGDLLIIALPQHHVWKLQMPVRTKIELTLLFSLGAAEIAISILRIVTLLQITFTPLSDFTWDSTPAYIFSVIEPALGIMIASAPIVRPVLVHMFGGQVSKDRYASSGGNSYGQKGSRRPSPLASRIKGIGRSLSSERFNTRSIESYDMLSGNKTPKGSIDDSKPAGETRKEGVRVN